MIEVESMALDMPVALGCDPGSFEDAATISEMGYFGNVISCRRVISNDTEESTVPFMGDDKLCYYSNVYKLFTS